MILSKPCKYWRAGVYFSEVDMTLMFWPFSPHLTLAKEGYFPVHYGRG